MSRVLFSIFLCWGQRVTIEYTHELGLMHQIVMTEGGHEAYLSLEHWAPFHPPCLKSKAMWCMGMGWMTVPGPVSTGSLAVTGIIIAIWISEVFFLRTSMRLPMDLKTLHMLQFLEACALLEWWCISVLKWLYRFSAFYKYNLNRFNLKNGDSNTVFTCWGIVNIVPYVWRTRFLVLGVGEESMLLHTLNVKTKVHLSSHVNGSLG